MDDQSALTRLPVSILTELQTHILHQPFMRENFSVSVRLSYLEVPKQPYLLGRVTEGYTVTNRSSAPAVYPLIFSLSKWRSTTPPRLLTVTVTSKGHKLVLSLEDGSLASHLVEDDDKVLFSRGVPVEPGKSFHVVAVEDRVYPQSHLGVWTMYHMTENLELCIEHPLDVYLFAKALHPSGERFRLVAREPGKSTWRLEGGILPFQGVEYGWER